MMKDKNIVKGSRCKPVLSCNKKTGIVTQYASASDASEKLGIPKTNIAECLTETHTSTRGYKFTYGTLEDWKKGNVTFPATVKKRCSEKVPVIVFNPDTSVYGFFGSVSEAAEKIDATVSAVSDCLLNKRNVTKGLIVVAGTQEDYENGKVKYILPEKHGKLFPIVKVSFGGREIARYNSVADIVKENSEYTSSLILRCASHKTGSAYGFLWVYLDEWVLSKKR